MYQGARGVHTSVAIPLAPCCLGAPSIPGLSTASLLFPGGSSNCPVLVTRGRCPKPRLPAPGSQEPCAGGTVPISPVPPPLPVRSLPAPRPQRGSDAHSLAGAGEAARPAGPGAPPAPRHPQGDRPGPGELPAGECRSLGLLPARDGAAAEGSCAQRCSPGSRCLRGCAGLGRGRMREGRGAAPGAALEQGGHWQEQAVPEGLGAPFGKQRRASGCAV